MPNIVYRIIEVLSVIVSDLPLGTHLAIFQLLWTVLSGRLLESRDALISALSAYGFFTRPTLPLLIPTSSFGVSLNTALGVPAAAHRLS